MKLSLHCVRHCAIRCRCIALYVVAALRGVVAALRGDVATLRGVVAALRGVVATLRCVVATLRCLIHCVTRYNSRVVTLQYLVLVPYAIVSYLQYCNIPCLQYCNIPCHCQLYNSRAAIMSLRNATLRTALHRNTAVHHVVAISHHPDNCSGPFSTLGAHVIIAYSFVGTYNFPL